MADLAVKTIAYGEKYSYSTRVKEYMSPNDQQALHLAYEILGIDYRQQLGQPDEWTETHAAIIGQFSSPHPRIAGRAQLISPSRAAAIPAITARWHAQRRAFLSNPAPNDILYAWRTNMPANTGTRHPDELFDNAQHNFGHDRPINWIVQGITHATEERRALVRRYAGQVHRMLAQLRFRGEYPETLVDQLIDDVHRRRL